MRLSEYNRAGNGGLRAGSGRPSGVGSGGVDAVGILDSRRLPDEEFRALWDAIILDEALKDRLLSQAILNFTVRGKVDRAQLPLHGIIVLVGPPGTGKTSLARGLAARTAEAIQNIGQFLYLEVEPHSLASAHLGKSQKGVTELLGSTVAERAATQPVIVLLDEVETLASDRSKLSLEANPVDVHRATDAVLAQLDQLASKYPHLLFLATSNFPQAIDTAFLSRADLILPVGFPNEEGCKKILLSTLVALAKPFPQIERLTGKPEFTTVVKACCGLDGRRIRKLVVAACTFSKDTALDPGRLSIQDLVRAAEHEHAAVKTARGTKS